MFNKILTVSRQRERERGRGVFKNNLPKPTYVYLCLFFIGYEIKLLLPPRTRHHLNINKTFHRRRYNFSLPSHPPPFRPEKRQSISNSVNAANLTNAYLLPAYISYYFALRFMPRWGPRHLFFLSLRGHRWIKITGGCLHVRCSMLTEWIEHAEDVAWCQIHITVPPVW